MNIKGRFCGGHITKKTFQKVTVEDSPTMVVEIKHFLLNHSLKGEIENSICVKTCNIW